MYLEGFKEGEPYTSLTKCITINLISHGFNLNHEIHSAYSILEQNAHLPLTDLMEIHFLNLSAAQKYGVQKSPIEKRQKLLNWLQFIETDSSEVRKMLATTSPILQMLNEKIDVLSLNPEERKLYESRMKLKSDIATISEVQFKAGAEWGIAEGEARGSRQAKLETARLMKQANCEAAFIVKMTGLTAEEIKALSNN